MERPQWSTITDMVGQLRRTLDGMAGTQRQVLAVTGTAWSPDKLVKAVVGPRGQLVDLYIDPRVYRTPDSAALAATILSTVRAATDRAAADVRKILDGNMPSDLRLGTVGDLDVGALMRTHDADLAAVLETEEDTGA